MRNKVGLGSHSHLRTYSNSSLLRMLSSEFGIFSEKEEAAVIIILKERRETKITYSIGLRMFKAEFNGLSRLGVTIKDAKLNLTFAYNQLPAHKRGN